MVGTYCIFITASSFDQLDDIIIGDLTTLKQVFDINIAPGLMVL